MRPLVGKTINNRYRLDSLLSEKQKRAIFAAFDLRLGRPVAMKVIDVKTDSRTQVRSAFRFEATNAARIPDHPNLVPVFDYGVDQEYGVNFYVMNLLTGPNLSQWMRHNPGQVNANQAVNILSQAALGLSVLHEIGLIHCAMSPAHLVFSSDESGQTRLVVAGYDALQEISADTLSRKPDSPIKSSYAAPEQFLTRPKVAPASDVFSLALIGLEMLTGRFPVWLGGSDLHETSQTALVQAIDRISGMPMWLTDVLQSALRLNMRDRYADAAEFLDSLNLRDANAHQRQQHVTTATFARPSTLSHPERESRYAQHHPASSALISPKEDIIELKPNIFGLGINFRALFRYIRSRWRKTK